MRTSIAENKFDNVTLIQAGLSGKSGEAKLFTSPNSELNCLSKSITTDQQHEVIRLTMLDECMQEYAWKRIDFIKLDAEGEGRNILKGGKDFLTELSPLIMYELKRGNELNLLLINDFEGLGYHNYRLIPGLDVLVPFSRNERINDYALNLFCCKEDAAHTLEGAGFLTRNLPISIPIDTSVVARHVDNLPYSAALKKCVPPPSKIEGHDTYLEIIASYLMSLSESIPTPNRVSHLIMALTKMHDMVSTGTQSATRLATFSRIAFYAGQRGLGVNILTRLLEQHYAKPVFKIDEVFLPASPIYDHIDTGANINAWLLSSILEQFIVKHAFSVYFTNRKTLSLHEKLRTLGFATSEMTRRYELLKRCFP